MKKYFLNNKEYELTEPCPGCGNEIWVSSHGKTNCPDCGQKEVLPCADCPKKENFTCDWNKKTRCSEFPKNNNLLNKPEFRNAFLKAYNQNKGA